MVIIITIASDLHLNGGAKMLNSRFKVLITIILTLGLILSGCSKKITDSDVADNKAEIPVEKIKVYASFYPLYDFASKVGGELVEVSVVVPPATEPHSFEPTPRTLADLENADVFIYNGLEFEPWVEGVLELLAGKNITIINASEGLDLIKLEEDDHDHDHEDEEDDHDHERLGEYDPHIWLDPINAIKIADSIKNALVAISTENTSIFEENFNTYKGELEKLDAEFTRELGMVNAKERKIIVSHSAFRYLVKRYGIEEISVAGTSPHAEPTPAKLAELTKVAKKHNIKHIFFEVLANPKTAEVLSKEANLEPMVLYNIEGLSKEQQEAGEDYVSLMYKNLDSLKKALVK